MLDRGLARIFDVRTREDAQTQQEDALIPCDCCGSKTDAVRFGPNLVVIGCVWQLAPS